MSTAESRSRALDPGPLITLYQLDLAKQGGGIFYFHDNISQGVNEIVFGPNTYTPYPIKCEGFEWNTSGTLPTPKLTVSNVGSQVSALLREYNDLVGCKLTMIQTFAAFVQGGAEYNPANLQMFPTVTYAIQRKTGENNTECTFELSTPSDAEGVQLPRRQIIAHTCTWVYRGADCGFTSLFPVSDPLGNFFFTGGGPPDYKGPWSNDPNNPNFPYAKSDIVAFSGTYHLSLVANNSAPTTDTASWMLYQYKGAYNNTTVYAQYDFVYTDVAQPDGTIVHFFWLSLVANNNFPLSNQNAWSMDTCKKKLSDCQAHFGKQYPLATSAFPGCYKVQ
jgi:lambda family phage minor tail protein L